MSDYDKYFTDDIVFDDQTLAAIDHEEQKYLTQRGIKRRKVGDGWKPQPGEEGEDLPEVSLQVDGSYGIRSTITTAESRNQPPTVIPYHRSIKQPASVTYERVVQSGTAPRPTALNASSHFHSDTRTGLSFTSQTASFSVPKPTTNGPPQVCTSVTAPSLQAHNESPPHLKLQKHVEALQKKLEEVCGENAEIQATLKEATSARMTKEGEVAVLRRGIEKSAKDHAAQLAKLKTEHDEAAARYVRGLKEKEEELERMTTQVVFKHHEQESSRRSIPSAQVNNITKEWSTSQAGLLSVPNASVTPRRPSVEGTSILPTVLERAKDPKTVRTNGLPGFQNTFQDETSLPTSQTRAYTRKCNRNDASLSAKAISPTSPYPLNQPWSNVNASPSMRMDVSETEGLHLAAVTDDIHMIEAEEVAEPDTQTAKVAYSDDNANTGDDFKFTDPLNQKAELGRIILSHSLPSSTNPTIRTILGAPLAGGVSPEFLNMYSVSCANILEVAANTSSPDMEFSIDRVSEAFVTMIPILKAAHLFETLTALFNLLTVLVYSFPRFASCMLSRKHDSQPTHSHLLVSLCGLILDQREIAKTAPCDDLIAETIMLLEALCFDADDTTIRLLTYIPRNPYIWVHLIHNHQTASLLTMVIRLLVVLASHRKICRALLSMPEPGETVPDKAPEPTKMPLIERVCMLLVDPSRKDIESRGLKMSILMFFSLLSTSQPDVHAHLVTATIAIPSIILLLSQLTTILWEDEEEVPTASGEQIALQALSVDALVFSLLIRLFPSVHSLNQTLFFFHHLVFTSTSSLNLRQKIYVPQHWIFNGLMHHFIVTFGRLSYGEAPEWMNEQQRWELLFLTDMARDILEVVVDGPEADRTWQTYQTEAGTSSETDEEQMEKMLLGDSV